MIAEESPPGRIITFYSYKGGTGRSMAVANAACWLGRKVSTPSQKVLVMDWDLEAPGLHRFFTPQADQPENVARPGIINYFDTLQKKLIQSPGLYAELAADEGWKTLDLELPLDDYLIPDVLPGVDFIKAGEFDATYAELVSTFNWVEFYSQFGNVIETFRNLIASKYAYCLIDSRTGFTDVSGICTMLMPEKLVMVFTPTRQSLSGVLDLATRAAAYRRASDDFRPLSVFPLPSRIENAELSLKKEWRERYQSEFEETFRKIYELEKCELSDYFDEVQLPHIAYYSYGESIALLEERSDALSLSRAYENFFERLAELDFPWDKQDAVWETPAKARTGITLAPDFGLAKDNKTIAIGYAQEAMIISYARDDNASFAAGYRGWVDTLCESLTTRLTQLIGERPNIWRDSESPSNSHFNDALVLHLPQPAFLVAVLSPAYITSSWCLKELEEFYERATQSGGVKINNRSRIFKVVKSPTGDDPGVDPLEGSGLPRELRTLLRESLGYEFYEIDNRSGRIREFWPELGPDYLKKFLERLEDLAQDIKEFIKSQQLISSGFGDKNTIFLAETTPELTNERNEIKRTLQQHGYHVLPDGNLPFEDSTFEKKVRDDLEQSVFSIHLIGSDHTDIPAEEQSWSRLNLQHQLAAERVSKQHDLAMGRGDNDPQYYRLVWMPEGLQAQEKKYQQFLLSLQNDPQVYEGADVLCGTKLEDLKIIIQRRLKFRYEASETDGKAKVIYLIYDRADTEAVTPLRDYLLKQNYEVLSPFKDTSEVVSSHRDNLRHCDALLMFYGSADTINYKLKVFQRIDVIRYNKPLLAKGVYVSGPETELKKAFHTDEALVMKNFGEFSAESIKPFLEEIEMALAGRLSKRE